MNCIPQPLGKLGEAIVRRLDRHAEQHANPHQACPEYSLRLLALMAHAVGLESQGMEENWQHLRRFLAETEGTCPHHAHTRN